MASRQRRLNRTHINIDRPGLERRDTPLRHHHVFHYIAVLQHGDDDVGISNRVFRCTGNDSFIGKRLALTPRPIPQRHWITRIQQIPNHGRTHEANTKEGYMKPIFSHLFLSLLRSWRSEWAGSSKTVRSHGWRSRAYTDVFTACFGRACPLATTPRFVFVLRIIQTKTPPTPQRVVAF